MSTRVLSLFLILLTISLGSLMAQEADEAGAQIQAASATVIRVDPAFVEATRKRLEEAYLSENGSRAVIRQLSEWMDSDEMRAQLQDLQESGEILSIKPTMHPNEKKAIDWVNKRIGRIGLENVKFEPNFELEALDRNDTPKEKIRNKAIIRYTFGAGAAFVAAMITAGSKYIAGSAENLVDVAYLLLPVAGAGAASIALEVQFAHPKINAKIWAPLWRKGGALGGRLINITVNTLYSLTLYVAAKAASQLPLIWGAEASAVERPDVPSLFGWTPDHASHVVGLPEWPYVFVVSIMGGVLFHLAAGQYQTELSIEAQERRSMSDYERYSRETTAVVVNNGGRVVGMAAPGLLPFDIASAAMVSWAALKTFPQVLKTHLFPRVRDIFLRRKFHRACKSAITE